MSRKWLVAAALADAGAIASTVSAFADGHGAQPLAAVPDQAGVLTTLPVPGGNHLVGPHHVI
jgi:hypothetical protein